MLQRASKVHCPPPMFLNLFSMILIFPEIRGCNCSGLISYCSSDPDRASFTYHKNRTWKPFAVWEGEV